MEEKRAAMEQRITPEEEKYQQMILMEQTSRTPFSTLPFPFDPEARHPLLLFSHGRNLENQMIHTVSSHRSRSFNIPLFRQKEVSQVSPASQGWISLIDFKDRYNRGAGCYLLNTNSKQIIQLPSIKFRGYQQMTSYDCVLYRPTTDPECRYIFFSSSAIHWCLATDAEFQTIRNDGFADFVTQLFSFDGALYGLMDWEQTIVEVTFLDNQIITAALRNDFGVPCHVPQLEVTDFLEDGTYFVDCCGDLMLVKMLVQPDTGEAALFVVYKIDLEKRKCFKVHTIGDRAIFVPGGMVVSCNDAPGILKDAIYFIWDGQVQVYNLVNETMESLMTAAPANPMHLSWLKF